MAEIKYAKALERLEEIIKDIENEEVDIDELALKVKEAVNLVRLCKEKINKADLEVKDVVESFEPTKE